MKKPKFKKLKDIDTNKLFFICVILVGGLGAICFGSALFSAIGTFFKNDPSISHAVDALSKAAGAVGNTFSAVGGNINLGNLEETFSSLELADAENAEGFSSTTSTSGFETVIINTQSSSSFGFTPPASTSSASSSTQQEVSSPKTLGTVIRVVDGDTFIVNIDGTETKVRLIGVDTPESVAPDNYHKENNEEGAKVSEIVKSYIKAGDKLEIEYDAGRIDNYGRTLAYLYFENGMMIQDWLLMNGYAQVMTIQPNSKYADHFVKLEQQAMANKVGIWAD